MRKTSTKRIPLLTVMALVVIGISTLPGISPASESSIDPRADQILRKMSDSMAGMERFSVQTENTLEVVLRSGEKIQFANPANLSVWRPNKLYANRKGDIVNQEFYYDGKTLTLFMLDPNVFATVDAPPTIEETLEFAGRKLDVFAPGGDFIYSNAYEVLTEDVVSGSYIGLSVIDGVKCHHLAFRGNEVDWQIWVEVGEKPLPKKIVITSKWMTGAPQFTVRVRSWDLSPTFSEEIFRFTPPQDAYQIDFIGPPND